MRGPARGRRCGYGASAQLLCTDYGVRVRGVTLSQRQLEVARDEIIRSKPKIELKRMDWLANDFSSRQFDALYAIESTEHMEDKQRFFDEAYRTLKPVGRIGVCAWLHRPGPSRREAKRLLEPICGWFTEALDGPDLAAARRLIDRP